MNSTATRSVRIYLAMKDGPLPRSVKQALLILGSEMSHTCVETMDEADLIIFTNFRDIERGYNVDKSYAYLKTEKDGRTVAQSRKCLVIEVFRIFPDLIVAIDETSKKLALAIDTPVVEEQVVPLRLDAKRILVIDDTAKHQASAKSGLAGHRLTVVTGYEQAMSILSKEKFDVVLTDLHLPMSSTTLSNEAFKFGELVPYGILLMIEAARQGAKFVAVVTDLNHHSDPFSAAFDHYSRHPVTIDGAKVVMMHALMTRDGAKDWNAALERLMKE